MSNYMLLEIPVGVNAPPVPPIAQALYREEFGQISTDLNLHYSKNSAKWICTIVGPPVYLIWIKDIYDLCYCLSM